MVGHERRAGGRRDERELHGEGGERRLFWRERDEQVGALREKTDERLWRDVGGVDFGLRSEEDDVGERGCAMLGDGLGRVLGRAKGELVASLFESTEEHRVVLLFQCRVEDHQHRASVGELGQDVACERKEEDEYRAHRGQNLVDDDDDDGDDVVQVVMACLARPVSRDRRPTDYLVVTRRVEATT